MVIEIKKTGDDTYSINGKEVYRDSNSNLITRTPNEFKPSEVKAFSAFLKSETKNEAS